MRIAFDVKGTIEGPKKALVLRLFEGLQDKGHTCIVWSNYYGYAVDAIKDNNLSKTEPMDKMSAYGLKERRNEEPFDLAIEDDRSQTYLGANKFLFVDELTEEKVQELLK